MSEKVYTIITERIQALLEKGEIPWHKPWAGGHLPANFASKKEYRGINVFLLACQGYASPYWMSYKQVGEKGGKVRKGEKSTPVIFWKWIEVEEKTESGTVAGKKKIPFLRYYNVFNVEQCDGLDIPAPVWGDKEFTPIQEAEKIVSQMPKRPPVEHRQQRACYRPATDTVNMPKAESFDNPEEYYSTLFHELTHATGHSSRLNRKGVAEATFFGSASYSKEELVAEFGAAFLCGITGIENVVIENSAAYIAGWLKVLRGDKKAVVMAAAAAQKAADFIQGKKAEPHV